MAPQCKDPQTANRATNPTIYGLLPTCYHYKLRVTSNGRIFLGFLFTFGAPPKHPTRVLSNLELTKVICEILSARHIYRKNNYKGVGACLRCNITGTTTRIDAKRHRDAPKNIWHAPGFTSQEDQLAKSKERTNRMIAFLDKAGKMYWKKVTKWKNNKYKWEAAIAIELAKRGRGIVWQHIKTNKPPPNLSNRMPDKIFQIELK